MRHAISKNLREFIAVIVMIVIALIVGGYILSNQRFYLPAWVPVAYAPAAPGTSVLGARPRGAHYTAGATASVSRPASPPRRDCGLLARTRGDWSHLSAHRRTSELQDGTFQDVLG